MDIKKYINKNFNQERFMENRKLKAITITMLFCVFTLSLSKAQNITEVIKQVQWEKGPITSNIADLATIDVPDDYIFANGSDTRKLMEALGNEPSGLENGFFGPSSLEWFAVFQFTDIGYVKDDEKDNLNADDILASIKEGNKKSNEYREKHGFTKLFIDGWEMKPQYNEHSNNLEWAIRAKDENGDIVINHCTRLLGRKGVMNVTLVAGNSRFKSVLPIYQACLGKYSFNSGQKYAEYKEGDKLYEYGLTGLIVGGGAAVAAKTGLLKYLWKILVGAFVALSAFFKKLYAKIFKKKQQSLNG